MRVLFFDLETTGLPRQIKYNKYYPYNQLEYYAGSRIVEIALKVYDVENSEKKEHAAYSFIIKPDGFQIGNSHIHKITQEIAEFSGVPFRQCIEEISNLLLSCKMIVAHNIIFDKNILLSELFRYGFSDLTEHLSKCKSFCTSQGFKHITKIRFNRLEYKQPKLSELYEFLFNKKIQDAHSAMNDVSAMVECFFYILENNL